MFRRRNAATWRQAIDDWSAWMASTNKSEQTIRQWRWKIRRLSEAHLHHSPWRLSTEDLYTWYGSQGWSPGSMKSARSALRSFYGWAHEHGRTRHNPALPLHGVATGHGKPRPAGDRAVRRALDGATDKIRLMVLLGLLAGMRCGEIAACRWDDIDEQRLLVHGKGAKERYVPLHHIVAVDLAAEWSRRQAGQHGSGWHYSAGGDVFVFPGRYGGVPMAARWVSQELSAALGPGTTAHQLRHRFAENVLDATSNLRLVQILLGHESPDTTQIYTGVPDAVADAAVQALTL